MAMRTLTENTENEKIDNVSVCPHCFSDKVYVKDTRQRGAMLWRRRECAECGYRYTTYEVFADRYKRLEKMSSILEGIFTAMKYVMKNSGEIIFKDDVETLEK